MLDIQGIMEDRIAFYAKDIDMPYYVNGFDGTFAITEHSRIPEVFKGFLQHHFGVIRLNRVKIEKINEALNEIWEGPGSVEKVLRKEMEYRLAGKDVKIMASDIMKKTYDDDDLREEEQPLMTTADLFDKN